MFKHTKQISTIGPKSEPKEVLSQIVDAGCNVIRLNFSHGDYEEQGARITTIREINEEKGSNVAILLDTKGPEIRTHDFEGGFVELVKGNTTRVSMEEVLGTADRFSISYAGLIEDIQIGGTILLDDGGVELKVTGKEGKDIVCEIMNSNAVKNKRGVNVPNVSLQLPFISEKDRNDVIFAAQQDLDFVAASFVRRASDVIEMREILKKEGNTSIQIIAKIENQEGVDNVESILEVADGIMVARGDLGVEVPAEDVPRYQRHIIESCNAVGKVVVTATQMLESMQKNPRPTRAEVSDVSNAVLDGTDAVMLSGESAAGDYPVEAVATQSRIVARTEEELDHEGIALFAEMHSKQTVEGAIGRAVVNTVLDLDVKAVIALTQSGATARVISRFRPSVPVYAAVPTRKVARSLALNWGVDPYIVAALGENENSIENMINNAIETAKVKCGLKVGDRIVVTAGMPAGKGKTNMLTVMTVE